MSALRRITPALVLAALTVATSTARAQRVAASTLGADGSFNQTSQYLIGGTSSSFHFVATSFVHAGPSGLLLDQVRVGLTTSSLRTYVITLLRGADITTASTVTSWSVPITAATPGASLFTLAAVGNFALANSETYWLAVSGLGTRGGWSLAPTGTQRPVYIRDEFSTDWRSDGIRQAPAYEVTVRDAGAPNPSVVPEPASMVLMGTGLVALVAARRRATMV